MNTFIQVNNDINETMLSAARNRVRLGLCCINNTLRRQKIYTNRTCIRRTFTPKIALDLAQKNVSDILPIIEWNEARNIKHFRLSSDMFPHYTDSEVLKYEPTPEIVKTLQDTGARINQLQHRITMHPGQYCLIGAKSPSIFQKTVDDLSMHAWILDTMGIGSDGILCIHGGGTYGDKESAIRRWIDQFDDLPRAVKNRVALENCEKSYSVFDCLEIANACKIPVILDTHHYYCYCHLHPDEEQDELDDLIPHVIDTWGSSNPLFHISDQADGKHVGAHHDYIKEIPASLLRIPFEHDRNIDIEVEAKAKEDAILRLMNQYPTVFPSCKT